MEFTTEIFISNFKPNNPVRFQLNFPVGKLSRNFQLKYPIGFLVRYLMPRIKVEFADIDSSTDAEKVEEPMKRLCRSWIGARTEGVSNQETLQR